MNQEDNRAIALFEHQKKKIENFPSDDDEFWRNETLNLVEKFIGKDSNQYNLLSNHTFWPNTNAINIETEQSQRERGRKMIDLCISHINANGINDNGKPHTTNNYIFSNSHSPVINSHIKDSFLKNAINADTESKTPLKKSWIEVLYWIGGIIVAIILLYVFVGKHVKLY